MDRSEWNDSGGNVLRRFALSGLVDKDEISESCVAWLVALTRGLVGIRMTKLEERLLPRDGARDRRIPSAWEIARLPESVLKSPKGDVGVDDNHKGVEVLCSGGE